MADALPTGVTIIDRAGPYMELLARTMPAEFNRAIRHIGFWLRGQIKAGMRTGAPGGIPWKETSRVTRIMRRVRGSRQYTRPGGRLAQLVRYKHDKSGMAVHIGWIDKRVSRLAYSFQEGGEQRATHKQRRLYYALGTDFGYLLLGKTIKTPARQAIGPVYNLHRAEIPVRMEQRIQQYMAQSNARAGSRVIKAAASSFARSL